MAWKKSILILGLWQFWCKGASIYDVRTRGGKGVSLKSGQSKGVQRVRLRENADKEMRASKIGKLCRRHKGSMQAENEISFPVNSALDISL